QASSAARSWARLGSSLGPTWRPRRPWAAAVSRRRWPRWQPSWPRTGPRSSTGPSSLSTGAGPPDWPEEAYDMVTTTSDVYFDPYDVDIYADPYPVFRRLREEAPLYYNETYDFFALSRFEDVERGFVDHETFSSAYGGVLEAIKAEFHAPKGVFIMED